MKFIKLGTVCKLRNGYAFKSANFSEDGVPIIRISNINGNIVTPEKSVRTTYENIFENYKIIKGDILIAMSGATTGKFGIYNSDEVAYQNQRVGCFKVLDTSKINQTYLLHVLNIIKPIIEKTANGGAQPNISANAIEEITIPLPSLKEQIRIAQMLTESENLIQQRKESINLLDEFLKSTFLKMFGDPVRNEKGWNLVPLSKLGSLDRGVSKHRPRNAPELLGGKYPLIQTGEVSNSGLYIKDYSKTYSEIGLKQSKIWDKGTLLITIAANIAQTSILTFDACFPDSIVGFTSNDEESNTIYVHFLFCFFQKILEKNAPQAAQKNINLELLRKLFVPKPDIKFQNQFATIVEKVESLKKEYEVSLKELENMYGVLSQKAFKGELNLSKVNFELYKEEIKTPVAGSLDPQIEIENLPVFPEKDKNKTLTKKIEYEYFSNTDLEKIIDNILNKYESKLYFSINSIENEFNSMKIPFNRTFIINYLKRLLNENKIKQEYSGDTKQVMFKIEK